MRTGTPGPPSFQLFWLRKQLITHLGMTLEEFNELPWREAEEYIFYLELVVREENEQRRRGNAGR